MSNVYKNLQTGHLHLNDVYCGESDFEIINNSDSDETELNCCYKELNNDKDNYFEYNCGDNINGDSELIDEATIATTSTKSCNNSNNGLIFNNQKCSINTDNNKTNKSEKLILSLSQDQISRIQQQQHHQQKQKQENFKYSKNGIDGIHKSRSSSFTIPFTIVPIDISKNNENHCKTEKTNLPEIVLTSFENSLTKFNGKQKQQQQQQQQKKSLISIHNQQANTNKMGIPSNIIQKTKSLNTCGSMASATKTTLESHQQIQIHSNQNSPSPELLLDRTLSNESIQSLSNNKIEYAMNGITDDVVSDNSRNYNGDIIDDIGDGISSSSSTIMKKPLNLDRTLKHQTIDGLHHSSSSNSNTTISGRGLDQLVLHESKEPIPNDLKCRICGQIYRDPRTLNCLHSFCFQCLINENFVKDISIPFWSRPDHNSFDWSTLLDENNILKSANSCIDSSDCPSTSVATSPRPESRSSTTSIKSKKSSDKFSKDKSSKFNTKKQLLTHQQQQEQSLIVEKIAVIICTICKFCTEMPVGGIRQLPQNFILTRKIENIFTKIGNDVISNIWCSLCCAEITAAYHCLTCTINLCNFCKQAHERQKTTSEHNIKHLLELRKSRIFSQKQNGDKENFKCSLHPGFDLKSFCITCQQIICSDCTILLHKGHKCEPAHKIFKTYHKVIKDTVDKTKPLCEYAAHSITKLGSISLKINKKCNQVQNDVEQFMQSYFEALEVHRKTLLQQIVRARETKIQIILEQQYEMEKKASEAKDAVEFCEELFEFGNEIEILSYVNILLKRFDYCQKFKPFLDAKISDTLHFLPEIRAPSTKAQNNIPLYGIITTQIVEPQLCTLEIEGFSVLRVHRRTELIVLSRDADGVPLCHGGLTINSQFKYKDSSKLIDTQVSDRRDGTYVISFTPDLPGTITLIITIDNKHIKGSPFTLIARTVRPHRGMFHCCSFCSSKGSKIVTCACEGTMPGFKGCGHGHDGHPGRRHWSCCGNILENSECSVANQ